MKPVAGTTSQTALSMQSDLQHTAVFAVITADQIQGAESDKLVGLKAPHMAVSLSPPNSPSLALWCFLTMPRSASLKPFVISASSNNAEGSKGSREAGQEAAAIMLSGDKYHGEDGFWQR